MKLMRYGAKGAEKPALVDAQGQVLVAAGTRVNPLTIVSLSQRLLFFDARDAAQVRQARALVVVSATQSMLQPLQLPEVLARRHENRAQRELP